MLGSIIGDIIGSRFEGHNSRIKTTDFELFDKGSKFTDDTVLTIAVADWLMRDPKHQHATLVKIMQTYGRMYPGAGFSHATKAWLNSDEPQPYGSFTNLEETLEVARRSAEVSHDSEEGITAAQAVSAAIFMARHHASKAEIKTYIVQNFHYDLGHTIEGIRPGYSFDCSCEGSVPEAIMAFMDGEDFESVIRLAVSLGGDSDTQACIAGGIAEAYYGCIPKEIIKSAIHHLPSQFREVLFGFAMGTEYHLPKFE